MSFSVSFRSYYKEIVRQMAPHPFFNLEKLKLINRPNEMQMRSRLIRFNYLNLKSLFPVRCIPAVNVNFNDNIRGGIHIKVERNLSASHHHRLY